MRRPREYEPADPAPAPATAAPVSGGGVGGTGPVGTLMPWFPILRQSPAPAADPAPVSGTVNATDPVFSAILNALNAPPSVQLPAQYPGGSVTVAGTPGSRGPLLLAVAVAGALGLWYVKRKQS